MAADSASHWLFLEEGQLMGRQKKILLFAGTSEGRWIAEYLAGLETVFVTACVATEYGREMLPDAGNLHVRAGRLSGEEMAEMMRGRSFDLVIDATHPYAQIVSANIRRACQETGSAYLRVLRDNADGDDTGYVVNDMQSAANFLDSYEGRIFLTTGSKDLAVFMKIHEAAGRVYARILPDPGNLERAISLGLRADHLFCMHGPFSVQMNRALIRHILDSTEPTDGAESGRMILVTKDSGKAGGFPEKLEAAALEGIDVLIVRRPAEEALHLAEETAGFGKDTKVKCPDQQAECMNIKDTLRWLAGWCEYANATEEADGTGQEREKEVEKREDDRTEKRCVYLVGAGLCREQLTGEALAVIRSADLIAGAESVVRKTLGEPGGKKLLCTYDYRYLTDYLLKHPEIRSTAVLFSGDIGFFSGAARLQKVLEMEAADEFEIRPVSGISSAVHFLDRIGRTWQDVKMLSLHGRKAPLAVRLAHYGTLAAILGSREDVSSLCRTLIRYHMEETRLWIGSDLMQEGEQILSGRPADFINKEFSPISLVYLEWKPDGDASTVPMVSYGLPDNCFVRGRVPMTKAQIRGAILSALALRADSILYDIGAGTGSVSVEAARIMPEGQVVAIEKNPEGIALIRENAERFHTDNVQIVEGCAPGCFAGKDEDCSADLPAPTHAFIGGSSGNMKEIIEALKSLNPSVRIVVTAVTLETTALLTKILSGEEHVGKGAEDEDPQDGPEILQICVSRSSKLGRYHMMKPEDPVYLFVLGGK